MGLWVPDSSVLSPQIHAFVWRVAHRRGRMVDCGKRRQVLENLLVLVSFMYLFIVNVV